MNSVAKTISVIFHPIFFASYICLLLMELLPIALDPLKPDVHRHFLILIFLVTSICPVIVILLMKTFGYISSIRMEHQNERRLPFTLIAMLYLGLTILFHYQFKLNFTDHLMKYLLTMDILILTAVISTYFYKVSIHSLGIWGALGIVLAFNKITLVPGLFHALVGGLMVAGLVMTSRLQLNAHTLREVLWGSMLGLAMGYYSIVFFYLGQI